MNFRGPTSKCRGVRQPPRRCRSDRPTDNRSPSPTSKCRGVPAAQRSRTSSRPKENPKVPPAPASPRVLPAPRTNTPTHPAGNPARPPTPGGAGARPPVPRGNSVYWGPLCLPRALSAAEPGEKAEVAVPGRLRAREGVADARPLEEGGGSGAGSELGERRRG